MHKSQRIYKPKNMQRQLKDDMHSKSLRMYSSACMDLPLWRPTMCWAHWGCEIYLLRIELGNKGMFGKNLGPMWIAFALISGQWLRARVRPRVCHQVTRRCWSCLTCPVFLTNLLKSCRTNTRKLLIQRYFDILIFWYFGSETKDKDDGQSRM